MKHYQKLYENWFIVGYLSFSLQLKCVDLVGSSKIAMKISSSTGNLPLATIKKLWKKLLNLLASPQLYYVLY